MSLDEVIKDLEDEGKFGSRASRPITRGEVAEVVKAIKEALDGSSNK